MEAQSKLEQKGEEELGRSKEMGEGEKKGCEKEKEREIKRKSSQGSCPIWAAATEGRCSVEYRGYFVHPSVHTSEHSDQVP